MANLASLLKDEISRLSRREIRRQVQPLRKISAGYRRQIAALKRQVAALERGSAVLARSVKTTRAAPAAATGKPIRFVSKGLRSLRNRLGLSLPAFARLVGVSAQSVYNWEHKKATPRREQLDKIVSLRSAGKRDVEAQLSQKTAPAAKKRGPKKKRK
jgi:DNA-binding transcriptional regulator YiaG